jgi:hypothetical protein
MDKQRQEQVITALKEKGATHACPRCGHLAFEIIGDAGIPLSPPRGSFGSGPTPEIPSFLSHVAIAATSPACYAFARLKEGDEWLRPGRSTLDIRQ